MLHLPEFIVASREGLYVANRAKWRQLADGHFFGVALKGSEIYCFQHSSRRKSRLGDTGGAIVRFTIEDGQLSMPDLVATGFDSDCHQIEFYNDSFYLVDTRNQRILEFDDIWRPTATHQILPMVTEETDTCYGHINSIAGWNESIYVMLHNASRGIDSEVIVYDLSFNEVRRKQLPSAGCHDIVMLPSDEFLYCESSKGSVSRSDGMTVRIDNLFTRGLAIGRNEMAVGSSLYGARPIRKFLPGFITFLDYDFKRLGRHYFPAAPTQIRYLPETMEPFLSVDC